MSNPVGSPAPSLKVNQIVIQGRIEHISKYNDKIEHIVITPAPDPYSKPSLMLVKSNSRLGGVGDEVKVFCVFHGWANNYKNDDGEPVKGVKGFFAAIE